MLFNKDNKGTTELRRLTSSYYANNDFNKIVGEIELATEELAAIVGAGIISQATQSYEENILEDQDLIQRIQRPIAILATLRMYRKNDLSHEDDGRKFKVSTDSGEKLPWEWQLDRDDDIHLEEYYSAVDALIRYLNDNKNKYPSWTETSLFKLSQSLIIRNGIDFESYLPINRSERTYLLLVPYIREAQMLTVKRAYGTGWDQLISESVVPESDQHFAACKAVALLAMSMALLRQSLNIVPGGVIRSFMAENGMGKSEVPSLEDVERVAGWMADDAATWVDEMKRARDGGTAESYELIPVNDRKNKYFRL